MTLLLNGNDHGRDTLFIYFNTILRLRVLRRPRVLGFVIHIQIENIGEIKDVLRFKLCVKIMDCKDSTSFYNLLSTAHIRKLLYHIFLYNRGIITNYSLKETRSDEIKSGTKTCVITQGEAIVMFF